MNCFDVISGTMLIVRKGFVCRVKSIKSPSGPDPENSPIIGILADGVEGIITQIIPDERPTRPVELFEATTRRWKPECPRLIFMHVRESMRGVRTVHASVRR